MSTRCSIGKIGKVKGFSWETVHFWPIDDKAKMRLIFGRFFFQFLKICLSYSQLFVYNLLDKVHTASQTYFGFTQGQKCTFSELQPFTFSIWKNSLFLKKCHLGFGPCNVKICFRLWPSFSFYSCFLLLFTFLEIIKIRLLFN